MSALSLMQSLKEINMITIFNYSGFRPKIRICKYFTCLQNSGIGCKVFCSLLLHGYHLYSIFYVDILSCIIVSKANPITAVVLSFLNITALSPNISIKQIIMQNMLNVTYHVQFIKKKLPYLAYLFYMLTHNVPCIHMTFRTIRNANGHIVFNRQQA